MTRGIPTVYRGIRYRSRLEARWAAFFDACGWPYVYEPFDLPGWVPDFELGERGLLVEVKPFSSWREFEGAEAKASVYHGEVLFIGTAPRMNKARRAGLPIRPYIGWLRGGVAVSMEPCYDSFTLKCCRGEFYDSWDVLRQSYSTAGEYRPEENFLEIMEEKLDQLWGQACNKTQWEAR